MNPCRPREKRLRSPVNAQSTCEHRFCDSRPGDHDDEILGVSAVEGGGKAGSPVETTRACGDAADGTGGSRAGAASCG